MLVGRMYSQRKGVPLTLKIIDYGKKGLPCPSLPYFTLDWRTSAQGQTRHLATCEGGNCDPEWLGSRCLITTTLDIESRSP